MRQSSIAHTRSPCASANASSRAKPALVGPRRSPRRAARPVTASTAAAVCVRLCASTPITITAVLPRCLGGSSADSTHVEAPRPRSYQVTPAILGRGGRHNRGGQPTATCKCWVSPPRRSITPVRARRQPPHGEGIGTLCNCVPGWDLVSQTHTGALRRPLPRGMKSCLRKGSRRHRSTPGLGCAAGANDADFEAAARRHARDALYLLGRAASRRRPLSWPRRRVRPQGDSHPVLRRANNPERRPR